MIGVWDGSTRSSLVVRETVTVIVSHTGEYHHFRSTRHEGSDCLGDSASLRHRPGGQAQDVVFAESSYHDSLNLRIYGRGLRVRFVNRVVTSLIEPQVESRCSNKSPVRSFRLDNSLSHTGRWHKPPLGRFHRHNCQLHIGRWHSSPPESQTPTVRETQSGSFRSDSLSCNQLDCIARNRLSTHFASGEYRTIAEAWEFQKAHVPEPRYNRSSIADQQPQP